MSLEKLSSAKFSSLTVAQCGQIRGGGSTGGGRRAIGAERMRDENGNAMINIQYEGWTSDDIVGGTECFYGITTFWSGWNPY